MASGVRGERKIEKKFYLTPDKKNFVEISISVFNDAYLYNDLPVTPDKVKFRAAFVDEKLGNWFRIDLSPGEREAHYHLEWERQVFDEHKVIINNRMRLSEIVSLFFDKGKAIIKEKTGLEPQTGDDFVGCA